jgi:hypothetical protein
MNSTYNGNNNLKSVGVSINFTVRQAMEYVKCQDDYIYFITNYCRIVSLDRGLINFELYEYQKEFLAHIHDSKYLIAMMSRQMGKSQTVAAYILWFIIFHDNKTCAILANKGVAAREVLSRVKDMYELLPIWMQQGVKTWNKGDIELENGSKVFCSATSASGIRGRSVNLLYLDEYGIVSNNVADEFFASTYPTISSGKTTKVVITSTPLGYNHFWRIWNGAVNKTNEFSYFFAPWYRHPLRDQKWADEQRKNLGEVKYNQEVECSFIGSSNTLITASIISKMSVSTPIKQNEHLKVYHSPKERHTYVLVCDPAEGIGIDYSAITVFDITTIPYRIVATYRDNKVSPNALPTTVHWLATTYNMAFILCEINRMEIVANILRDDMEYDNILYVARGKFGQEISEGFGGVTPRYGVVTDKKVKRIGCATLKTLVENDKMIIDDEDMIAELSNFVERKGSYAADDGYHDDMVMTLVLFAWATSCTYFRELNDGSRRELLYKDMISRAEEDLTPFGFIVDGTEEDPFKIVNF